MFDNVNFIAWVLAVVVSMAIGAGWYGVLSKKWIAASGFSPSEIETLESGGGGSSYVVAAICHIIMAYVLSGVIYHSGGFSLRGGVISALFIWAGFVATSMAVNHRFQMKPWSLTVIDSGHYLLVLLAQGAILGWFGVDQ